MKSKMTIEDFREWMKEESLHVDGLLKRSTHEDNLNYYKGYWAALSLINFCLYGEDENAK